MTHMIESYQVQGTPPPWSVTEVAGFVVGVLQRVQRNGMTLPERFWLSACPWGERNAIGGTPEALQEFVDPRFQMVHFTGCGRPYLVVLFLGVDAVTHQDLAKVHLPWSEHFAVTCKHDQALLEYLGCTEEVWTDSLTNPRTLKDLLDQGIVADF